MYVMLINKKSAVSHLVIFNHKNVLHKPLLTLALLSDSTLVMRRHMLLLWPS